jgi:hypothetical protein
MLDLPPELQDSIFSLLDKQELLALVQVSRQFRQRATFYLLLRYHIQASEIYTGSVYLHPEAYFLFPLIYYIQPVLKLAIFPVVRQGIMWLQDFPSILAAVPLIPDITICGHAQDENRNSGVAMVIATLSHGGRDPVVIAAYGGLRMSLPRPAPPLKWLTLPDVAFEKPTPFRLLNIFLLWIPWLIVCAIVEIVNVYRSLAWLYRRAFGPLWDPIARIEEDVRWSYRSSMRIQSVSGAGIASFAVVTFSNFTFSSFTISRLPALSSSQYAALLTVLDLNNDLRFLTVMADCALNLPTLLAFVHRHQLLHNLVLVSGAIDSASLTEEAILNANPGRLTSLSSPAAYIPYILLTEPYVQYLTIDSTGDGPDLVQALNTIASSDTAASTLSTLTLNFTRRGIFPWRLGFPWRAMPDTEADLPLRGVKHLVLILHIKHGKADVRGLPHWLAFRFPALVSLEIRGGLVPVKRAALVQAIVAARVGINEAEWEDVYFHD